MCPVAVCVSAGECDAGSTMSGVRLEIFLEWPSELSPFTMYHLPDSVSKGSLSVFICSHTDKIHT